MIKSTELLWRGRGNAFTLHLSQSTKPILSVEPDAIYPGKPLFWDRTKSTDEADALMRHFLERGSIDSDGVRHSAKMAWRALAILQKEIEQEKHDRRASPDATANN